MRNTPVDISYSKLWKLIEERELGSIVSLFQSLGISTQTLNAMRNKRAVSLSTIDKLCTCFKCQPGEIMEIIKLDAN